MYFIEITKSCDYKHDSAVFTTVTTVMMIWPPFALNIRNNTPDRQKLGAKLNRRRGVRAYACQCSWVSVLEATDLRGQPQLTWVCSKHHN